MKVTPMIFNGDMVRAMLREIEKPGSGKRMTRRVVKRDMANNFDEPRGAEDVAAGYPFVETGEGFISAVKLCPYGQPGDLIYVRETWANNLRARQREAVFRSDFGDKCLGVKKTDASTGKESLLVTRWQPSIHMPRWASRMTLEITGVRVERLQDISEEDARAEGAPQNDRQGTPYGDARTSFICLWDSIYFSSGKGWGANPWVWVIGYKPMLVNVDEYIRSLEANGDQYPQGGGQ